MKSLLAYLICFYSLLFGEAVLHAQLGDDRTAIWSDVAPIGNGVMEVTKDSNAFITVHRPVEPNGAAFVICPGGGYGGLVVGGEGHGIAKWLNKHGITGVVLEYRLPRGRHAVPLLDAQRAIRLVRANSDDLQLDKQRIGIMGFSAGGHLASTALTHFDEGESESEDPIDRFSCRPDFGILVYPVVTMREGTHGGSKLNLLGENPTSELLGRYSNEEQVTTNTPPIFLAHAKDDRPVPPQNSRQMFASLQEHGVTSEYLELPSGGHGLNGYQGPMWDAWQTRSLEWLRGLDADQGELLKPNKKSDADFLGRRLQAYEHASELAWGYEQPQRDSFLVLHPRESSESRPLYVVLHSAGHDVRSALECTQSKGNHDIYHSPDDHFALYLDCRANRGDWWWGIQMSKGGELSPTEKRVVATVRWVIQHYGIDRNRVYLCGNSMGGSGALGIGIRHGDLFAAIKANVPAGIEHVSSRMYFGDQEVPVGLTFPDPPIVLDYSAQNDGWSKGHDQFAKAMRQRRYPLMMYWGPFGHANNHENILKVNDLINSFDWLEVRKNQAYPVFTDASTDDELPWPNQLESREAGQINAFFRWGGIKEKHDAIEMQLWLVDAKQVKTQFDVPRSAQVDCTLRRLQSMKVSPGSRWIWEFGTETGVVEADGSGCLTIRGLVVETQSHLLTVKAVK